MGPPNAASIRNDAFEDSDRPVSFVDSFASQLSPGRVVGSRTPDGVLRTGVDAERVISIDNGALRIEPLVNPGWGRSGVAYGPYKRRSGLTFGAFLVNGHNISRTEPLPDGFKARVWRWAIGTEVERPATRLRQWLRVGQKREMWRRLLQWIKSGTRFFQVPRLDENLAVGWFPTAAPSDPLHQGNGLLVHAIVPEGGEIWVRTGPLVTQTVRGIQNLPMCYAVVLRESGAAYYASSLPGVPGLPAFPAMRPLAIDAFNTDDLLYPGVHQSVLGEIGFRATTRVYQTQVSQVSDFDRWYGTASRADRMVGEGTLHDTSAETGGRWQVIEGEFHRTDRGVLGVGVSSLAFMELPEPSGLVHLLVECADEAVDGIAIVWRAQDENNFWCFEVGSRQCQLSLKEGGNWTRFPSVTGARLLSNAVNAIQVFDDGQSIRLYLNSDLVYGSTFTDSRLTEGKAAGVQVVGARQKAWLRSFEAHPRQIEFPLSLGTGVEWVGRDVGAVVVADQFDGPVRDLAGRRTTIGDREWRRDIGQGLIELTGHSSARVVGSVERPCPGRTAYTVDWTSPDFADVEVTITPPGIRKWLKEKGRAGILLWQDPGNYLILSAFIGDWPAMSMAAFFQMDGFEELYDAVWTNVGGRMHWGVPHDLRVVFDGMHFTTFINREPVLYRALRDVYPHCVPLRIRRVGIVANWEWGNDTGSAFQNFVARGRP